MPTDDYSRQQARVFSPWKTHNTLAGVPHRDYAKVLVATVIGIALFFALGTFKADVQVAASSTEILSAENDLKELRKTMQAYAKLAGVAGTDDVERLDLSTVQKERVSEARNKGIGTETPDEQISAMVSQTKTVKKEVYDPIPRAFVCIVLPGAATFFWHMELGHGWSPSSEFARLRKFRKRQRFFVSRKRDYLAKEKTG